MTNIITEYIDDIKVNDDYKYLGLWCFKNDQDYYLKKYNSIVPLQKHTPGKKKYDAIIILKKIDFIKSILYPTLNRILKVNKSNEFWDIYIGHWLFRFVSVLYNRYSNLKQLGDLYSNVSVHLNYNSNFTLSTKDSLGFCVACNNDLWNDLLNRRIIDYCFNEYKITNYNYDSKHKLENSIPNHNALYYYRKLISKYFTIINKQFINYTYLTRYNQFLLNLSFNQIPQNFNFTFKIDEYPSQKLRSILNLNMNEKIKDDIWVHLISEMLPSSFLENFNNIALNIKNNKSIKHVDNIFIANNYEFHDLFSFWLASKDYKKLLVAQHGGIYGMSKIHGLQIAERVADKFLTWGWDNNLNSIKGFCTGTAGMKRGAVNNKIILVDTRELNRIYSWDVVEDEFELIKHRKEFIRNLSDSMKNRISIKLYNDHNFEQKKVFWDNLSNKFNIIKTKNFKKLKLESKLIIETDFSTSFLENISLNIPTILLPNYHMLIFDNAVIRDCKRLFDVNICHSDSKNAAKFLIEVCDNIDEWWFSKEVQEEVSIFRDKYCRHSKNPVRELKKIINNLNL